MTDVIGTGQKPVTVSWQIQPSEMGQKRVTRYLIRRGLVIGLVRGGLQVVVLVVVRHQLHAVLSLRDARGEKR